MKIAVLREGRASLAFSCVAAHAKRSPHKQYDYCKMKPGSKDKKLPILISGKELSELQRHSEQMVEAFGLDRRIENYQGKRPIGFYSWDFDCILAVIEHVLDDPTEYPDKQDSGYIALRNLFHRLKAEYRKFD